MLFRSGVFYIAAKALGLIDGYESIAPPEGTWLEPEADPVTVEQKYRKYLELYERMKGFGL